MRKLKLILSEQAQEDLVDVWLYIAADSPQAADSFIDLLYEKSRKLCDNAQTGCKRDEVFPEIRSLAVKRHLIFYRITEKSIEIVRVLSGYRDLNSLF